MRECGTCQACCTLLRVFELNKPEGTPCSHLCATGCQQYATRPASCVAFTCGWLAGDMSEAMRPDLSGVLIERMPLGLRTVLALTAQADTPIPQEAVDFYTTQGRAIAARGQRVFLPDGMTHNEVRLDLYRASVYLGV